MPIKIFILSGVACAGAAIASLFGGWTGAMTTLVILMFIDYVTGIIVAGGSMPPPKAAAGHCPARWALREYAASLLSC